MVGKSHLVFIVCWMKTACDFFFCTILQVFENFFISINAMSSALLNCMLCIREGSNLERLGDNCVARHKNLFNRFTVKFFTLFSGIVILIFHLKFPLLSILVNPFLWARHLDIQWDILYWKSQSLEVNQLEFYGQQTQIPMTVSSIASFAFSIQTVSCCNLHQHALTIDWCVLKNKRYIFTSHNCNSYSYTVHHLSMFTSCGVPFLRVFLCTQAQFTKAPKEADTTYIVQVSGKTNFLLKTSEYLRVIYVCI